jgi:8-oxo-dGTP pyrophosphatase MutT (NUDIX family)
MSWSPKPEYQRALVAVNLIFTRQLPETREDHVLLIRRCNTGWHDGEWSLVAGHVDTGESPLMAALREAEEEVGLKLRKEHFDGGLIAVHRMLDTPLDGNEGAGYIDFGVVANLEGCSLDNVVMEVELGHEVLFDPESGILPENKANAFGWFPVDTLKASGRAVTPNTMSILKAWR